MKLRYFFFFCLLVFGISSCAYEHPENSYFGNYSEAEQLYRRGQYEKAIQRYQAYIDENPEGNLAVISLYYIGKSRRALGQIAEAKSIFQKIMHDNPDLVWANLSETQVKEIEAAPTPEAQKQVKVKLHRHRRFIFW